MSPTINLNLKPCAEWCRACSGFIAGADHSIGCPGVPIPVPCPLPPTVEMTVQMVECVGCIGDDHPNAPHSAGCPARPVHVSCTIGGDGTWVGSEVVDVEPREAREAHGYAMLNACRERWKIVRALMTGKSFAQAPVASVSMVAQRDAVFASLARVARMEKDIFDAQGEYASAIDEHHHPDWHRDPESYKMPSQDMLALYVERLIEEVEKLP